MAIDVNAVAHLARLEISPDTIPSVSEKLEQMKTFVEHINSVDTTDVVPMAHPLDQVQRLRSDTVTESDQRSQLHPYAPQTEASLYLVPKVIEKNSEREVS